MSVNPRVRDVVRQWPKRQPRRPKLKPGFPKPVIDIMDVRSGGLCEIDLCGPVCEWHHRGPRALGGTRAGWVNRAANGLGLAADCHRRVESNRTQAYMNGWLVARNGIRTADQVPVLYRDAWVLLGDDGSVTPVGAP